MLTRLSAIGTALALACGAGSALASSPSKPALRIADPSPLTLSGGHFKSYEAVRIHVSTTSAKGLRHVRAGANGSFRAAFARITLDRCSGLRVDATGARGSRAHIVMLRLDVCGDD